MAVSLHWRHRPDLLDFQSLCQWLQHPAVGLGALQFHVSRTTEARQIGWHWPLRVGVLADGDRARLLETMDLAQAQHPWIGSLTRRYTLGSVRDACDLLIVTSLDALMPRTTSRMRASFVACLDEPPPDPAIAVDRYGALATNLDTAGIGWVGRPSVNQETADWFEAVVREVSHDVPLATTLRMAAARRRTREPLIVGDMHALDECRILAIADRQDRVVVALGGARSAPDQPRGGPSFSRTIPGGPVPDSGGEPTFGGPSPESVPDVPAPLRGILGDLADQMRNREFTAESVDGVRAVHELGYRENALDQVRAPRWVQANGWRPDAPERPARSFLEEQWNLLAVHIGPTQAARSDASFPESGIDFSHGDVKITVQIEVAGAALDAVPDSELSGLRPAMSSFPLRPRQMHELGHLIVQVLSEQREKSGRPDDNSPTVGLASATILLPAAGDSTVALFAVRPQEGVGSIAGRVVIMHGNRALQTAKFAVGTSATADVGNGIAVETEAAIHPGDDDLDERRKYAVTIVVSDIGGKLHLAIQRNDEPTPVDLSSLKEPIGRIRDVLKIIANKWDYPTALLDQTDFHQYLYGLAGAGSQLELELRNRLGDDIDQWRRIHLLPFTNEFLPLEYVYSGPPPEVGARVCGNVVNALREGKCGTCPNRQSTAFVCPMQFWGFHRVIERSSTSKVEESAKQQGRPCVPTKDSYRAVSSLLFAASNRAFNYAADDQRQAERAGLVNALNALWKPIPEVDDWAKWRVEADKQPNLLFLVVHTDKYVTVPVLEIGNAKFLGKHEIRPDITGNLRRPLLLVLLGCSVAGVEDDFQPYPELFHNAGASIVLATIASIRGIDAVQIAKRLSTLLAQRLADREPTPFGELLPLVRRQLLSDGYPGAFGLIGFGDGDWLLGGRDAAT